MVWAYFDETAIHTKDAATGKLIPSEMLVGGCLASAANWQKLSAEWKRALKKEKVKVFHSKDFYSFRREFAWHTKGGQRDLKRHNAFRDKLADIITSHVDEALAFTSQLSLKKNGKVRQSYLDAAMRALHDCTKHIMQRDGNGCYVIFARHPEVSRWTILRHFEQLNWDNSLLGCGVFEPNEVPPLQAADFVLHSVNRSWGGFQTRSEKRLASGFRKRNKIFRVQIASSWQPPAELLK